VAQSRRLAVLAIQRDAHRLPASFDRFFHTLALTGVQGVDDFLETSGIAFGIKDSRAPRAPLFFIGEVAQIEHYIAKKTGGQYLSAPPEHYAAALEAILCATTLSL
jgi:hypothetical protein